MKAKLNNKHMVVENIDIIAESEPRGLSRRLPADRTSRNVCLSGGTKEGRKGVQ